MKARWVRARHWSPTLMQEVALLWTVTTAAALILGGVYGSFIGAAAHTHHGSH